VPESTLDHLIPTSHLFASSSMPDKTKTSTATVHGFVERKLVGARGVVWKRNNAVPSNLDGYSHLFFPKPKLNRLDKMEVYADKKSNNPEEEEGII
jgi:hypothetical protein